MPAPEEGPLTGYARTVAGGRDGARRYATSKLLTTASALGLAREDAPGPRHVLRPRPHARHRPRPRGDPGAAARVGHRDAGARRAAVRVLDRGPVRAALARLATTPPAVPSGTVLDHRLRPVTPSATASDPAYQDALLADSRALLAAVGGRPRPEGGPRGWSGARGLVRVSR